MQQSRAVTGYPDVVLQRHSDLGQSSPLTPMGIRLMSSEAESGCNRFSELSQVTPVTLKSQTCSLEAGKTVREVNASFTCVWIGGSDLSDVCVYCKEYQRLPLDSSVKFSKGPAVYEKGNESLWSRLIKKVQTRRFYTVA